MLRKQIKEQTEKYKKERRNNCGGTMKKQTKRVIRKSLKRNERPKLMIDVFEYFDYLAGKTKRVKYKKPKWLIEAEKEEEKMTLEEEKEWLEKAIKVCEEKDIKGLREL